MSTRERNQKHIVDDSGHNLDVAVINILNDLAHEPQSSTTNLNPNSSASQEISEQIDSFFEMNDDL